MAGKIRELQRRAARNAIPLEVMLELTHRCNFRCQHCYIPDFNVPDALDLDRVFLLLEELVEMGTLVLTLSGGEVFLHRDWKAIARRARDLGFALSFFTNGFFVDRAVAKEMRRLSARVEVSLYSLEEEIFDTIVRRPGALQRVLAGIEVLLAEEVPLMIKAPLMSLNQDRVEAVRRYAERIGAGFRTATHIAAKKDGDLAPIGLRVPFDEAWIELGGPSMGCQPRGLDGPLCAAASSYCVIDPQGNVMACNILPGSGGNIRDRPFREIWESSPWLNEIRGIRAEDLHTCKSCEKLSFCGRCHAMALVEDGDLYGPSTWAQQRADTLDGLRDGTTPGSRATPR